MADDDSSELATFGARVRHFRQLRGLTQSELAERVGLDRKTVNRLEAGHYSTSLRNVYRLAEALETEVPSLFTQGDMGASSENPVSASQ